jgi:hypothetical protein
LIRKISLIASLLVLVFIFLPWVSVSCSGQQLLTITGRELVTGFSYNTSEQAGTNNPEIFAIVVAGIAVLSIIVFFIRNKGGAAIRGIFGIAGIVLLLALKAKIDGDIRKEGEGLLQASYLLGYWLTFISFLSVAVLNFLDFLGLKKEP